MIRNHIDFSVASKIESSAAPSAVILMPIFSSDSKEVTTRPHKRFESLAAASGFKGEIGDTFIGAGSSSRRTDSCLLHFGLGKREEFDLQAWRDALSAGFKAARALKVDRVELVIPFVPLDGEPVFGNLYLKQVGKVTGEIVTMTLYQRNHHKTQAGGHEEELHIKAVTVVAKGLSDTDRHQLLSELRLGADLGDSVNLARDLANEPANICTPTYLADQARRLVHEGNGTLSTYVYDAATCAKRGMNCFLAVAKGSDEPAQFIVIKYIPTSYKPGGPSLGLVGKGVTFDSGGLDIKPADGMRGMEYDMCGGADVIAVMRAIALAKLPIQVTAFVAATENMTGGSAYRPGDVYIGVDGKSRVVDNTDAEGRMTLVDAIAIAIRDYGVTHVVDYATLTGACVVALGDVYAGMLSNNQEFADKYLAAASAAGELCHQLPLSAKYKKQNKSPVGDFKNTGGRKAGTITAAHFVLEAADKTPAIHVDIAGMAERGEEDGAYPAGGTGWGVLTLFELARIMSDS